MVTKYTIEIPSSTIKEAFSISMTLPPMKRGNFFHDVRMEFKKQIEKVFREYGIDTLPEMTLGYTNCLREGRPISGDNIIKQSSWPNKTKQELDMQFCAGYGYDDYSLLAINYLDRAYCELPSLQPFMKVKDFSLGNILIPLRSGDYEIDIVFGEGLRATGYSYRNYPRKQKCYFCIFGIHFDSNLLSDLANSKNTCLHDLDEVRIDVISYPFLSICRRCGELFTCTCFEGQYSVKDDILRLLPYGNNEEILRSQVENIHIVDGICSLCTGRVPTHIYGSEMYYSSFLQRYLPYFRLYSRKHLGRDVYDGEDRKSIENALRERFGYPKIGEKWISETILFKVVNTMFFPMEVIHHYRGGELQGLEIDIWIPEIRLGIEYQGEQHYQAIDHWGGEEGLKKRQENDRKKKILCKKVGYTLIEFHHFEELSEEVVWKKLSPYLPKDTFT